MEDWQRLVIKRHLPELIDLTSCNTELLTRLFSKDILTEEEIHEIVCCSQKYKHTLNPELIICILSFTGGYKELQEKSS